MPMYDDDACERIQELEEENEALKDSLEAIIGEVNLSSPSELYALAADARELLRGVKS